MLPISNSRTYRHYGEICNLEETKERIEYRVGKLRKAINRRTKLGEELWKIVYHG